MNPIADGSLGSQFWVTTDLSRLSELYGPAIGPEQPADPVGNDVKPEKGVIGNDSVLTSLAGGSESSKFTNVLGQARMLAPLLSGEGQQRQITIEMACGQLNQLCPTETFDRLVEKIVRLSRHYIPDAAGKIGNQQGGVKGVAEQALARILFSKDFAERAHANGDIGHAGKLALVNAALGLMKMACEGKVDLEQSSDYMFGEVTDLSKPADVLRLAVRTAQAAREKFVDEAGLATFLEQATQTVEEDPTRSMEGPGFAADLKRLVDELIGLRKAASKRLDLTMDLGEKISKSKIESRLKDARESMRAFRYDLDRARGIDMGFMESLRRRADDLFSSGKDRMTSDQYRAITDCEGRIRRLLADYGIRGAEAAGIFHDVGDRADLATKLTHATNNHIRYYFSGAESRREKFAAKAHEMFDPLVAKGGSKTVSFEVGLDARAGFKVGNDGGVGLDLRAGAKYVRTAKVSVSPGGGEVTVTYYDGVALEGSLDGNVGVGKWNGENTDKPKVGANFNAKGEVGGGKGRTVTYPSLDAFIADCNGESSLVSVGPAHSFLCLGKIYQGCRALLRGGRTLLAKLGLVIHKSVVDSNSYRALLQRNGVMRKVDTILSNAPRHVMKTSETAYHVVTGGFSGGGGMSVKLYRGIDEKYQTEKSASVFDLSGSLGYSGERQLHVRGQEMRARIDTLRLESDEMLAERLDEAGGEDRDATRDLVAGLRGDTANPLARLTERLIDLENEAAVCGDDQAAWRRICRRLEVLTVRYVQLERELEAAAQVELRDRPESTAAQKRLEEARAFFTERLANPQMSIPEGIFREELVDVTSEMRAGKSVHKASFKVSYDAGTGFVTDVAKTSPKKLQPEKTVVNGKTEVKNLNYGQQLAQTLISNPIGTAMGEIGLKGSVELAVTVEESKARDVRPWKNGKTVLFDVKLAPNLPIRVIVETIANKRVDQLTDEGRRPADVDSVKKKVMSEVLAAMGIGITTEALLTEYANLTIMKVVDATLGKGKATEAQKFFAGPFVKSIMNDVPLQGLETGMDINYSKTIQFRYEHGQLACMSVSEDEKMESTLGVRFKAGPVGIGLHMKTGYSQSYIERSVYANPHFDTLLGRTSEFLRGGTRGQLSLFLAHNKVGALKAFDTATQADGIVRERIDGAKALLDGVWALRNGNVVTQKTRSLADRALRLKTMLAEAEAAVNACDGQSTEAEKLKVLEELLVVLVRAYDLAKEDGQPPANMV